MMAGVRISIHTPRMGARQQGGVVQGATDGFQSTRPAWGRDFGACGAFYQHRYFNPHAPMGARHPKAYAEELAQKFQSTRPAWGRDAAEGRDRPCLGISIHTPRMGARPSPFETLLLCIQFQSTRPAWGRDHELSVAQGKSCHFNPHAPHGGATPIAMYPLRLQQISIHTPRMGARLGMTLGSLFDGRFQSTRPAWGRDVDSLQCLQR